MSAVLYIAASVCLQTTTMMMTGLLPRPRIKDRSPGDVPGEQQLSALLRVHLLLTTKSRHLAFKPRPLTLQLLVIFNRTAEASFKDASGKL